MGLPARTHQPSFLERSEGKILNPAKASALFQTTPESFVAHILTQEQRGQEEHTTIKNKKV